MAESMPEFIVNVMDLGLVKVDMQYYTLRTYEKYKFNKLPQGENKNES